MKLHSYWRSSCSWRVRIGLAHKGVSYEYVPVHLVRDGGEQHAADYLALNGLAQVPTLTWRHDGERRVLTQSLAILEWLEAERPSPPLIPNDAFLAAQVREQAEIVNAGIQPLQNLAMLQKLKAEGADAKAFGREVITRGLAALERSVTSSGGAFCVGEQVTLADLCLIPQLYNARRFEVELSAFPRLLSVEASCAGLPAFIAAHPDKQPDAPVPETDG